ncbi:MAG TPA: hypothetical protein VJS45_10535 [Acidimicrobiia bacterium]|nr:hypothetical protein [Acidimicrobiia bacterium]
MRRWVSALAFAVMMLTLGPAAADAQNDRVLDPTLHNSEEPGSLIVFPKFHRGRLGNGLAATTFEIGVVCPVQAAGNASSFGCPFPQGTPVKLKLHWVCPATVQKGAAGFCYSQDFELHTTVHGKVEFDASGRVTVGPFDLNGGIIPVPECLEGFLIAYVVDTVGRPIIFNGLIGEQVLRLRPGSASAYNGITFQAGLVSRNGSTDNGVAPAVVPIVDPGQVLRFDGVEYRRAPAQFAGDVRYEKLTAPPTLTFLTLLTLDVRANAFNPNIVAPVNFYRANEVPLSDTLHFTCWRQIRLTDINPNLTVGRMGPKGMIVSTAPATVAAQCTGPGCAPVGTPVTVLGIVTTLEDVPGAQREYGYALFGVGPGVDTTFDPTP